MCAQFSQSFSGLTESTSVPGEREDKCTYGESSSSAVIGVHMSALALLLTVIPTIQSFLLNVCQFHCSK